MPTDYESWMNGQDREPFDLPDGPTALIVVDMQNSYVMDDLPRPAGTSRASSVRSPAVRPWSTPPERRAT